MELGPDSPSINSTQELNCWRRGAGIAGCFATPRNKTAAPQARAPMALGWDSLHTAQIPTLVVRIPLREPVLPVGYPGVALEDDGYYIIRVSPRPRCLSTTPWTHATHLRSALPSRVSLRTMMTISALTSSVTYSMRRARRLHSDAQPIGKALDRLITPGCLRIG